ncbi:MAG TPA: hypothetical protein VHU88_24030 [Sporichthyaceae bacterium]|jgi:hypothetical protein|nr:hypothetical protein [Sporichthyaceae bacterium]
MVDRRRRRRTSWATIGAYLGVGAGLGALPLFGLTGSAKADDSFSTFTALAAANGVSVQFGNDSIPVAPTPEISGPVAQASLDPLGSSLAYASFPYPGDTLVASPKLVGGVFGVPMPAYPLIVSTSSIPETQTGGTAGISLRADSQADESEATSVVGDPNGVGSSSLAQVVNNSGSGRGLTATAATESTLSRVGGVFSLQGVRSSASATSDGAGVVKTLSTLQFSDLFVPGLSMEVPAGTPGSVPIPVPIPGAPQLPAQQYPAIPIPAPFGGTTLVAPHIGFENGYFTVALPQFGDKRWTVPASTVLSALKGIGIEATYSAPVPIVQNGKTVGVLGAALQFSTTLPAPPRNAGFNGPTKVSLTIGRSIASLKDITAAAAAHDSSTAGSGPIGIGSVAGDTTPGPAAVDRPAPQATDAFGSGALPVDTDTLVRTATANSTGATARAPAAVNLQHYEAVADKRDTSNVYLALMGVALIGSLAAGTVRLLGVRVPWTS